MSLCRALPGGRAAPCGTAPIGVQPTGQAEAPEGGAGRGPAGSLDSSLLLPWPLEHPPLCPAPGLSRSRPPEGTQAGTTPQKYGVALTRTTQRLQNPRSQETQGLRERGGPSEAGRTPSGSEAETAWSDIRCANPHRSPGNGSCAERGTETQRPEQCRVTQPSEQTGRPRTSAPSPSSGVWRLKVRAGRGERQGWGHRGRTQRGLGQGLAVLQARQATGGASVSLVVPESPPPHTRADLAWPLPSQSGDVTRSPGLSPASPQGQRPRTDSCPSPATGRGAVRRGAKPRPSHTLPPGSKADGRTRWTPVPHHPAPRRGPEASAPEPSRPIPSHRLSPAAPDPALSPGRGGSGAPRGRTYRSTGSALGSSAGWAARPPPAAPGRVRGPRRGPGRSWSSDRRRPRAWAPRPPPHPPRGSPRSAGTWWPQ